MKNHVLVAALLLVTGASAASYTDPVDVDDPALDIVLLEWTIANETVTVDWTLAAAPGDGSYTAIVFIGLPNATEPDENYVLHHGPGGTRAMASHTDPVVTLPVQSTFNNTTMQFTFDRVEPSQSSCNFAIGTTSVFDGENRIIDRVPDEEVAPSEAWQAGAYCLIDPVKDAVRGFLDDLSDETGVPGPGPALILAALGAATRWRHKAQ